LVSCDFGLSGVVVSIMRLEGIIIGKWVWTLLSGERGITVWVILLRSRHENKSVLRAGNPAREFTMSVLVRFRNGRSSGGRRMILLAGGIPAFRKPLKRPLSWDVLWTQHKVHELDAQVRNNSSLWKSLFWTA